ncbi:hypothetical protein OSJ77_09565 [Phyllobacterium sp. 0TCS1.6C]|uniref:hypothetical protein n=2 Tax=unclassified Phyllobacterium TaxID=2638441 RepID=UPI00226513D4|nr:hypothetical protein [Phyllobacterium sp. 0TCS1.6C]MCX8280439.1 hypothetical protein [Phyllobacterium sp. 0TCS1.6C]MCX8295112.1 hypothetical protein [Phyllobacterium sp. 0TCS1.6A]
MMVMDFTTSMLCSAVSTILVACFMVYGAIKTKQETDARIALIDRELQRRAEQAAE